MLGKLLGTALLACGMSLGATAFCGAAAKVTVKTEHYQISGKTGRALLDAMDRKGPKHGFMTRAIAQTRYTMKSAADWERRNGICRPYNVRVELAITYVYPKPSSRFDADLAKRWNRFMEGVVVHEEMHGRVAREMAQEADRTIRNLAVRDRGNCAAVDRAMRKKVNAIVTKYEKRQEAFDDAEHREGGKIDRLVGLLVK